MLELNKQLLSHISTSQSFYNTCKTDPANLNHLYTLIGHLCLVVDDLTTAVIKLSEQSDLALKSTPDDKSDLEK